MPIRPWHKEHLSVFAGGNPEIRARRKIGLDILCGGKSMFSFFPLKFRIFRDIYQLHNWLRNSKKPLQVAHKKKYWCLGCKDSLNHLF